MRSPSPSPTLPAPPIFWSRPVAPPSAITLVLGLPGNPVSAFVTAILFLCPLVARLAGASDPLPRTQCLPLVRALRGNGERTAYLRATIEKGAIGALQDQDSAGLAALAAAEALIIRAPHAPPLEAGASVEFLPLA
jgi:molybdopterin molybdotransferase